MNYAKRRANSGAILSRPIKTGGDTVATADGHEMVTDGFNNRVTAMGQMSPHVASLL